MRYLIALFIFTFSIVSNAGEASVRQVTVEDGRVFVTNRVEVRMENLIRERDALARLIATKQAQLTELNATIKYLTDNGIQPSK